MKHHHHPNENSTGFDGKLLASGTCGKGAGCSGLAMRRKRKCRRTWPLWGEKTRFLGVKGGNWWCPFPPIASKRERERESEWDVDQYGYVYIYIYILYILYIYI